MNKQRTYIGAGPTLGPGRKGLISPMNSPAVKKVKKNVTNTSNLTVEKLEIKKNNGISTKSYIASNIVWYE